MLVLLLALLVEVKTTRNEYRRKWRRRKEERRKEKTKRQNPTFIFLLTLFSIAILVLFFEREREVWGTRASAVPTATSH